MSKLKRKQTRLMPIKTKLKSSIWSTTNCQKRSKVYKKVLPRALRSRMIKGNNSHSSNSNFKHKSKMSSKPQNSMKRMMYAQHVPKVLTLILDTKNCPMPSPKPKNLTRQFLMRLNSQLLWNRLLNGSIALRSRLEKKQQVYQLTILQSPGCRDKYTLLRLR